MFQTQRGNTTHTHALRLIKFSIYTNNKTRPPIVMKHDLVSVSSCIITTTNGAVLVIEKDKAKCHDSNAESEKLL